MTSREYIYDVMLLYCAGAAAGLLVRYRMIIFTVPGTWLPAPAAFDLSPVPERA